MFMLLFREVTVLRVILTPDYGKIQQNSLYVAQTEQMSCNPEHNIFNVAL